jgi:hypothetical protein
MDNEQNMDQIFIDHIEGHLRLGQRVVCKICGESANEIIKKAGGAPPKTYNQGCADTLAAVREVLETRRNESLYMGNAAVSNIMAAIEQRLGDNDKEV